MSATAFQRYRRELAKKEEEKLNSLVAEEELKEEEVPETPVDEVDEVEEDEEEEKEEVKAPPKKRNRNKKGR